MLRWTRRHARWLIAAFAFALLCTLRAGGFLQPLENAAADARARLMAREASSDIVVVGIDARSLAGLPGWPWPRSTHAELLRKLYSADAPPERIFLDIDFGSRQRALDDAHLEMALRDAPVPVQLPLFLSSAGGAGEAPLVSRPLPQFGRHAELVSVNRDAGSDGITRHWRAAWPIDGRFVRSVIDPGRVLRETEEIFIDYSISPASFRYVSYIDLLEGRVPPGELAGKSVFVGNVSAELGDMAAVPVHGALPGVMVQALATQTVAMGAPRPPAAWGSMLLLAGWAVLGALGLRGRFNHSAAVLAVLAAGIATLSVAGFAWQRWWLDVATPLLMLAAMLAAETLLSLNRETARALTYALGLRRRDALLRSIVQSSSDCILCIEEDGRIRTANPAASRLFGCAAQDMIGRPGSDFIPALAGVIDDSDAAVTQGTRELDARWPSGDQFPVEIAISRVRLKTERLFTAIVRDIRERRAQQLRLQHQATHDALTGLPNRAALLARLEGALVASPTPDVAVLMLDLCRFKEVNDALGHHVGDQVLCEVARRFSGQLPPGAMIARIGGDEFTVVMEGAVTGNSSAAVADALAECLKSPIEVAGIGVEVGVSIGIALRCADAVDKGGNEGRDATALLRESDVAMYSAKRRGTVREFYDAANDENTVRRLAIGGELRSAIGSNALQLHFQPQVKLGTGLVESCEALVRWFHPQHGAISPAEFIALAETTDLIRPLTEWTLRSALEHSRQWRAAGIQVRVAVNLSARMLQDTTLPARLRSLLQDSGIPATALEVEITESAMMLDPARALRVIQEIHDIGVMISIDDFGTGYSSLGYLRDLPVHALKLDQSFVRGMREREGDRIIVESTAQMAHALRLELVAEGVESRWHADVLAAAGYDYAQGYLYSPALPAERFVAWLADFNAAALLAAPSGGREGAARKAEHAGPQQMPRRAVRRQA